MNGGIRVFAAIGRTLANSDRCNDCQSLAVSRPLKVCPGNFPEGRDRLARRHVEHEEPTPISGCKELSVRGETHGAISWVVTTKFPKVFAVDTVQKAASIDFSKEQVTGFALRGDHVFAVGRDGDSHHLTLEGRVVTFKNLAGCRVASRNPPRWISRRNLLTVCRKRNPQNIFLAGRECAQRTSRGELDYLHHLALNAARHILDMVSHEQREAASVGGKPHISNAVVGGFPNRDVRATQINLGPLRRAQVE